MAGRSRTRLLLLAGFCLGLLGASLFRAAGRVIRAEDSGTSRPAPASPVASPAAPSAGSLVRPASAVLPGVPGGDGPCMPTSLAPIVDRALPAVVNISSTRVVRTWGSRPSPFFSDPFFRHFFGGDPFQQRVPQERREQSLGSGVIISADGYVVTNAHVLQDGEAAIQVYWEDHSYDAKVVGRDAKTDVALLKIDAGEDLPFLPFGDSDSLRVGDFVLAIGNPFGLDRTVTMGIVSAVGRADIGIVDYEDFIQTDAAINPGNSGGALLDLSGRLIGINTAIVSRSGGYQGIGFAIPSRMADRVVQSLREHGEVRRGWIGLAVQELTPELSSALGLDGSSGVLVSDVYEGGPADRQGVQQGDVITEVDGHEVKSVAQFRTRTERLLPGDTASFSVQRSGRRVEVQLEVERTPEEAAARHFEEFETSAIPGLALETLEPEAAQRLGYSARSRGVLITSVKDESAAAGAGLQPGDIIIQVNRVNVGSLQELESVLSRSGGEQVLLLVQRGRQAYYVALPRTE